MKHCNYIIQTKGRDHWERGYNVSMKNGRWNQICLPAHLYMEPELNFQYIFPTLSCSSSWILNLKLPVEKKLVKPDPSKNGCWYH
jgi:hypothetical protein